MRNRKFYKCLNCGHKFFEINEGKECPKCHSKNINLHHFFKSDNTGENELIIPLNKEKTKIKAEELAYVSCLNPECNKKIHADEVEYINNKTRVRCPHCDCEMSFILEGPLNMLKLTKILKK